MALVDSLLTAMVRADGDALVMHVGERPIVVSGAKTIDLSTHGMNLGAMVGMLGQLLSGEALASLKEFGAVEHALPARGSDYFSVVAARSGNDIWIEIRRRRGAPVEAQLPPVAESPDAVGRAPAAFTDAPAVSTNEPAVSPADAATASIEDVSLAPLAAQPEPSAEPQETPAIEQGARVSPEPVAESGPESVAPVGSEPDVESVAESESIAEVQPEVAAVSEPDDSAVGGTEPDTAADRSEPVAIASPEPSGTAEAEPDAVGLVAEPAEEVPSMEVVAPAASAETALATRSHGEVPALPVMASAGASAYPASTVTPGVPMDPARHVGSSAGGPPSRPADTAPSSTGASSGAGTENAASPAEGPVTRTVRIEVPPRAPSSRAAGIDRLLRAADGLGASELFLVSQARPYIRVGGNVRALQDEAPLLPTDIESLIADVTPEPWRDAVRRGDPADWLIELADVGRVRCSTFRDHRGPGANFHFAFLRATTADELQLNADTRLLATEPDGLVLVAGGPGSDMSAIVAAFVDILNHQRADYVITLEPQVRVLHVNREALVSQREVGHDQARLAAAARAALRESPDVLVIEGVASGEVAQLAIEAAAQNRLVIASIDAPSATAAVQRLVELVPAEQRQAARAHLARCFRGAVAQLLLRKTTGGRIAARELMSGTRAVARIIADGDLARLAGLQEAGGVAGLAPLADTIVEYVRSGLVDVREAVRKAPDTEDLVTRLEAAGVNLHALERWG